MTPCHAPASTLDHLTDVQLLHRLNDAIRERERTAEKEPRSRAAQLLRLRQWQSPPLWSFVAIAQQLRDALVGAWLVVSFASPQRIKQCLACSEAKWEGLLDDIAILRLLGRVDKVYSQIS